VIPMRIEAGLAFGTGHHETTALCLHVLSDLSKRRRFCERARSRLRHGFARDRRAKLWRKAVLASHRSGRRRGDEGECAREWRGAPDPRPLPPTGSTIPHLPVSALRSHHREHPGRSADKTCATIARALAPGGMLVLSACSDGRKTWFSASIARMGCKCAMRGARAYGRAHA